MKKIALFILLSFKSYGQESSSVEKSLFNIQSGFVGVWINNELKLNNKIVLRTEIGIEPAWYVGNGSEWHPNIRLEPRYYYNLKNRTDNKLNIRNNSGNFFGIALNYRPGNVIFSNNNIKGIESYSVVPKWGIRRTFSKNFNYEAGAGLGFRHEVDYGNYAEIDLHLRIGYSF